MTEVRVERDVKDLQIGDVLYGQGVVRSVVPAPGGKVYVLLEKTIMDTTTFEPEEKVLISLQEETAE